MPRSEARKAARYTEARPNGYPAGASFTSSGELDEPSRMSLRSGAGTRVTGAPPLPPTYSCRPLCFAA